MSELTPMMKQYLEIKEQNKDCILFFRLGDFYEMFNEDARIASRELDLVLTTRDKKSNKEDQIPMCGIPYHSCESYISRLISRGYKVAICEQVEDPALAKGLVKREIVRTITPGTLIDSSMLDESRNNYICSIVKDRSGFGICFIDMSTGEAFASSSQNVDRIVNELGRFSPAEVALSEDAAQCAQITDALKQRLQCCVENLESVSADQCDALISQHFGSVSLDESCLRSAVGGLLAFLHSSQKNDLSHINRLEHYLSGRFMELDITARQNLELTETFRGRDKKGSLLWVLDSTKTPMGSRMIRSWLEKPLLNVADIRRRSAAVAELVGNTVVRSELRLALRNINDLERLIGRIVYGSCNGRDLISLSVSASVLPKVLELAGCLTSRRLTELTAAIDPLDDIMQLIDRAIVDEPPITIREGGLIRQGYDQEVDRLHQLIDGGATAILDIEARERERTGISKLKTGYNRVFGYYIEVPRSYTGTVPGDYIRKQTLANNERYITPELKELESDILTASERITSLEYRLFIEIKDSISAQMARIQSTAAAIAELDVLCSLAEVAVKNSYCQPEVDVSAAIEIRDGRHPVVEKMMSDSLFVPNDTIIDGSCDTTEIITGPNMAGKSTYMRQVALIVLMAQIGSFVPARYARIGIVDRIFTRIGASDDLSSGKSTFMVEMTEVANILRCATSKSLLILDEIGRGTSTFDGMAIARAVLEHVAVKLNVKTLFATHYHELTCLEAELPGVKNYNIAVKKRGDEIIFLRKIVRGGTDDSYGIEVAKLAGVPDRVIKRARQILSELEQGSVPGTPAVSAAAEPQAQMSFADVSGSELVGRLRAVDLNVLTPIEAMNLLFELKKIAGQ